MTLVLSTSSSLASWALLAADGAVIASAEREASRASSGFLAETLAEAELPLDRLERVVADVGPGSLTGVKVGVAFAKVLAAALGIEAGGVSAFDLLPAGSPPAVQIRRNLWLVRSEDDSLEESEVEPEGAARPSAIQAGGCLHRIRFCRPEELVPEYGVMPSISRSRNRMLMGEGHDAGA